MAQSPAARSAFHTLAVTFAAVAGLGLLTGWSMPLPVPGTSLYWAAVGLGKRSVVLDLNDEADKLKLRDLIDSADVLVESFVPGYMASVGLGYESVSVTNPGLIYTAISPYGQDGPDALSPASELSIEAAGGLVNLQGDPDRNPIPVGFPQAGFHAGAQAAAVDDQQVARRARRHHR